LSSSIDPANGIDTSEMANFLNMFAAVVYLQNGGLVTMVDVLNQINQHCPVSLPHRQTSHHGAIAYWLSYQYFFLAIFFASFDWL
ncbi:flagellar biosynthetic protein FliR, partial [Salmonella enterica subsp. enterica serovar Anatum]|nr:flagellar biosynthetic protein FliR [Salmonella enterica subsp. enterica serovar Anatum]